MGLFEKLFGKKDNPSSDTATDANHPKFIKKEQNGPATYEIYKAGDPEIAKTFLATKRVDKPQYYVIVETPQGNWGIDVKGLYLEKLLPWQSEIGSAECEGRVPKMPDMFSLQMAAKGLNNNFVIPVQCGKCEHEWIDGIRYQNSTVVRCPKCRTLNKVDSSHFKVVLI